mmetsp:Transcript_79606/g.246891  ORF Transcript_79606/g.246891 Transcript_79606/m.246891 type:complete len:266 (-) Transcript_79606:12-809(-)
MPSCALHLRYPKVAPICSFAQMRELKPLTMPLAPRATAPWLGFSHGGLLVLEAVHHVSSHDALGAVLGDLLREVHKLRHVLVEEHCGARLRLVSVVLALPATVVVDARDEGRGCPRAVVEVDREGDARHHQLRLAVAEIHVRHHPLPRKVLRDSPRRLQAADPAAVKLPRQKVFDPRPDRLGELGVVELFLRASAWLKRSWLLVVHGKHLHQNTLALLWGEHIVEGEAWSVLMTSDAVRLTADTPQVRVLQCHLCGTARACSSRA